MLNPLREAVERLAAGQSLSAEHAERASDQILAGESTDTLTAAFLTALHMKGECPNELLGAVRAIRKRMIPWSGEHTSETLLDTCGSGGDGAETVNVSTAASIVAASCGIPIVKHGNRAASGNSGSSDVLAALGVAVDVDSEVQRQCLRELGLAFLYAPRYHPGLKVVASIRQQLPFRTVFNLVGPLCNPASPGYQLVGVPRQALAELMAGAFLGMPHLRRAVIVTGSDGLDEVTLDGPTHVRIVEKSRMRMEVWNPSDFGLEPVHARELRVSSPDESALKLRQMFLGENGPVRRIVLANAAAAIWTVGVQTRLRDAVRMAAQAIDSGATARLVERWADLSHSTFVPQPPRDET